MNTRSSSDNHAPFSERPFVTVITPTRNSERFLEETMRSVAMQRDRGTIRVEHLVMDGNSTDRTEQIVSKWAHPDTCFIRRTDDQGPADAINAGLRLAKGEYVCWLNSDDVYAPFALERAVAALERNPKAPFCFGRCRIINQEGREIRRFATLFKNAFFPVSNSFLIHVVNYISQPAMVFRADAFRKIGFLRTDFKAAWDYDFTLRLWHLGKPIAIRPPELAYFRWTPSSISGSQYERQFKEGLVASEEDIGHRSFATVLHGLLARGLVFLYKRVCSRTPEPVSEERVDRQCPDSFLQANKMLIPASKDAEKSHNAASPL